MVHPLVFAVATGIGLLTDKYMLEATNFAEHYAVGLEMTSGQKAFVKSAMYLGAISGMMTFGPISDVVGRRKCLIACSVITLLGALLSMGAWSAEALIAARIITGIGMGGEYPLAASHSAESATDSNDGARNVALLYLFGSGGGPVVCAATAYFLDVSGLPDAWVWRSIFGIGALLALFGLVLRFYTTTDGVRHAKVNKVAKGTRREFLRYYWKPLLGTASIWFFFDIVEYGLKQNDADIFSSSKEASAPTNMHGLAFAKTYSSIRSVGDAPPYSESIMAVLLTRLLVIPSLIFAPWILTKTSSKRVQFAGFCGCTLANFILALKYEELKGGDSSLFFVFYIAQLSFQSMPGVTTMAISAEIFPNVVRGTFAAISAASGKLGAAIGSYVFTWMAGEELVDEIFWVVTGTSTVAMLLTLILTPYYDGSTLDAAEEYAEAGKPQKACETLYGGPLGLVNSSDEEETEDDEKP
eukprot:TRINITY_DN12063_c1_g1_i1.p1 TRINITY_DN12063_c1_g1~~TRINITY_DN12063_c1_g1_i1.p1  ORF type:complete len:470 (+),score=63.65 TRINITY_DN12063_c1_g1_i1:56-1465(+)